ncbi:HAMP domain-containing sensor histidine kinase [bacterium]|nr:HAMP domain-containing sensor histidine kinase [bacterium]
MVRISKSGGISVFRDNENIPRKSIKINRSRISKLSKILELLISEKKSDIQTGILQLKKWRPENIEEVLLIKNALAIAKKKFGLRIHTNDPIDENDMQIYRSLHNINYKVSADNLYRRAQHFEDKDVEIRSTKIYKTLLKTAKRISKKYDVYIAFYVDSPSKPGDEENTKGIKKEGKIKSEKKKKKEILEKKKTSVVNPPKTILKKREESMIEQIRSVVRKKAVTVSRETESIIATLRNKVAKVSDSIIPVGPVADTIINFKTDPVGFWYSYNNTVFYKKRDPGKYFAGFGVDLDNGRNTYAKKTGKKVNTPNLEIAGKKYRYIKIRVNKDTIIPGATKLELTDYQGRRYELWLDQHRVEIKGDMLIIDTWRYGVDLNKLKISKLEFVFIPRKIHEIYFALKKEYQEVQGTAREVVVRTKLNAIIKMRNAILKKGEITQQGLFDVKQISFSQRSPTTQEILKQKDESNSSLLKNLSTKPVHNRKRYRQALLKEDSKHYRQAFRVLDDLERNKPRSFDYLKRNYDQVLTRPNKELKKSLKKQKKQTEIDLKKIFKLKGLIHSKATQVALKEVKSAYSKKQITGRQLFQIIKVEKSLAKRHGYQHTKLFENTINKFGLFVKEQEARGQLKKATKQLILNVIKEIKRSIKNTPEKSFNLNIIRNSTKNIKALQKITNKITTSSKDPEKWNKKIREISQVNKKFSIKNKSQKEKKKDTYNLIINIIQNTLDGLSKSATALKDKKIKNLCQQLAKKTKIKKQKIHFEQIAKNIVLEKLTRFSWLITTLEPRLRINRYIKNITSKLKNISKIRERQQLNMVFKKRGLFFDDNSIKSIINIANYNYTILDTLHQQNKKKPLLENRVQLTNRIASYLEKESFDQLQLRRRENGAKVAISTLAQIALSIEDIKNQLALILVPKQKKRNEIEEYSEVLAILSQQISKHIQTNIHQYVTGSLTQYLAAATEIPLLKQYSRDFRKNKTEKYFAEEEEEHLSLVTNLRKVYPIKVIRDAVKRRRKQLENTLGPVEIGLPRGKNKETPILEEDPARLLAHEVKNSVTGIALALNSLNKYIEHLDIDENNFAKQTINRVNDNINNLTGLVKEILSKTKTLGQPTSNISVAKIVNKATFFLRNITKEKNIQIDIAKIDPSLLISKSSNKVQQVLINLIINSIEAIKNNGAIQIAAYKKDGNILIQIKDNGPGISKENQRKVFEPNFTTKEEGNGLGLYICQKIINELKGNIKLSSTNDQGCIFTITLLT